MDIQEMTPNRYDVIKAICEELFNVSLSDLARGDIEKARKHLAAYETYKSLLRDMEEELETP